MLKVSLIESVLLFLFGSCIVLQVLAATCYHLDGTNAGPSNALCNPNATGTEGSHSACCNAENGDACLSTGLCLNTISRQQSHLLWATACTDPTFKDPSCPQYCHGLKLDNAHLKTCNDTFWCCESDAKILTTKQCCDNSFKLTQPIGTIVAQLQSGGAAAIPVATASPVASDSSNVTPSGTKSPAATGTETPTETPTAIPSGAVAGLAIEAVIMVLALAGLGFMIWRNKLLSDKVKEAEAAVVVARSVQQQQQQQQQYQWQPPPSSHSGVIPQTIAYNYGSPVESEPKRSELHSPGLGAYQELPGTEVIGTELSSEPRTPRTPRTPGSPFVK
ncbi:hypothetical protein F5Y04DRAFT_237355 [Hypomontagnella monticulosa]|nr:hypothetical protein F5Y04DRAFT_237355 [Hypomontagnella monticulosa]